MTFLLRSEVAADAARKLPMRLLGLAHLSGPLQTLARLQQVRRQIGPANVDAQALDQARALDDGAAGFPKRTPVTRARLDLTLSAEAEHARLEFDLAHVSSVRSVPVRDIRGPTESGCGLLLNREDAERGGGRRDERDERYGKGSLSGPPKRRKLALATPWPHKLGRCDGPDEP